MLILASAAKAMVCVGYFCFHCLRTVHWAPKSPPGDVANETSSPPPFELRPAATAPIKITAVVSAASYVATIAPGQIVVLFGSGMGPTVLASLVLNQAGFVPTELSGTVVTFDGIPAPIIYSSATQVSVVVPYALEARLGVATRLPFPVVVSYQGNQSPPLIVNVGKTAPALFTADSSGTGQLAAVNEDGSINGRAHPIAPGKVIVLFATGEGQTEPPGVDGKLAVATYPKPVQPVTVEIGDRLAEVLYAGAAPTFVAGLMQINVKVPTSIKLGFLPVSLQVGSDFSRAGGGIWVTNPGATIWGFTAASTTIAVGNSTALQWNVTGATSLEIDNGVGDVTGKQSVAVHPTSTTTYTLKAHSAERLTPVATTTIVVVPNVLPVISSFTADRLAIPVGSNTTLRWSATGATRVSIDGIGTVSSEGSIMVTPSKTTTYTLQATNPAGTVSATVTILVGVFSVPRISKFEVDHPIIPVGYVGSTTLQWITTGATSLNIDNGVGEVKGDSGSILVKPGSTTTYTLTATSPAGSAVATATLTVGIPVVPVISSFTADTGTIASGGTTTLRWTTSGATSLSIDNGVGEVTGGVSVLVKPLSTTTYRLRASNSAGSVTAAQTIVVTTPSSPGGSGSGSTSSDGTGARVWRCQANLTTFANAAWVSMPAPLAALDARIFYDTTYKDAEVSFRNRYTDKIYFSYEVFAVGNSLPVTSTYRKDLPAGGADGGITAGSKLNPGLGGSACVVVDQVRFGVDSGPYVR